MDRIAGRFDLHFDYIRGEDNTVANTSSCKHLPIKEDDISPADVACVASLTKMSLTLSDSIKASIRAGYDNDSFCKAVWGALPLRKDCADIDGLLFVDGRLVIPANKNLHPALLSNTHTRLGHLGHLKTLTELRRDFFWPRMTTDVLAYIKHCKTCQRTKAPTTAPPGKMATPTFPQKPLVDLAIDFVGPLKSSSH